MAKDKPQVNIEPTRPAAGGYGTGYLAYDTAGYWVNNESILRTFVAGLTEIARKGVPELNSEECARLAAHGELLTQSIDAFMQLQDAEPVRVPENFAYQLLQVVRSACLITSLTAANPATQRKVLKQIEPAVAKTRTKSHLIDNEIIKLMSPILRKYPTWKTGRFVNFQFVESLNQQLKEQNLPSLKRQAIVRRINKLRTDGRSYS